MCNQFFHYPKSIWKMLSVVQKSTGKIQIVGIVCIFEKWFNFWIRLNSISGNKSWSWVRSMFERVINVIKEVNYKQKYNIFKYSIIRKKLKEMMLNPIEMQHKIILTCKSWYHDFYQLNDLTDYPIQKIQLKRIGNWDRQF